MSPMVTRIRKGAKPPVYLREWRKHLKLKAEAMAERLEIERESYYRLERNPKTFSLGEVVELADAMGIEPAFLFHPPPAPERPSIDLLVKDAPDEQRALVVDLARRVVGQGS